MSEIGYSSQGEIARSGERGQPHPAVNHAPAWFAVFTVPRHEKRIAEHFADRHIESFLPLYRTIHRWKNRCNVELELPLFPSYIFARIERRERVRVLNVPGVLDIIGCSRELLPVPDDYIEWLRRGVTLGRMEPHANVSVGDKVRITQGPMAGMEGMLVRANNNHRVVLRLESIMQSVCVEVSVDQVERLDS